MEGAGITHTLTLQWLMEKFGWLYT